MSGRAYARHPAGGLGGATDIESFIPHGFRLPAPVRTNSVRAQAIKRVIQRRCKEKNWKKLLRVQHARLFPLIAPEESDDVDNSAPEATNDGVTDETMTVKDTQDAASNGVHVSSTSGAKAMDVVVNATGATANGEQSIATNKSEELALAKQKLQELQAQLATLSEQKHAKFQQLKGMLIAEARAKSSFTMPTASSSSTGAAGAGSAAKRRRLDSSLTAEDADAAAAAADAAALASPPSLSSLLPSDSPGSTPTPLALDNSPPPPSMPLTSTTGSSTTTSTTTSTATHTSPPATKDATPPSHDGSKE